MCVCLLNIWALVQHILFIFILFIPVFSRFNSSLLVSSRLFSLLMFGCSLTFFFHSIKCSFCFSRILVFWALPYYCTCQPVRGYALRKNLSFHLRLAETVNSSGVREGISYLTLQSMLGFDLAWASTSLVYVVTTTVSSYVQIPCCDQDTMS